MKRTIAFNFQGEEIEVVVERNGNTLTVQRNDETYTVELTTATAPPRSSAPVSKPAAAETAAMGSRPSADAISQKEAPSGAPGAVPAPMTGTIKEVLITVGDRVQENEQIVMMEAMKMDIEVAAPQGGTVVEILVEPGDGVRESQTLLRIE